MTALAPSRRELSENVWLDVDALFVAEESTQKIPWYFTDLRYTPSLRVHSGVPCKKGMPLLRMRVLRRAGG